MGRESGFGYCTVCGQPLSPRYVEEEERERLVCPSCLHIHYVNPKIVAGTIPVFDGKVWLLRRAIEPRYGFWTFPAGYMEIGETVQQAAERETYEELTLRVEVGDLLGVYSWPSVNTVHIVYLATALNEPEPGREALEMALVEPGRIPWDELAFTSTHRALGDWILTLAETE